MNFFEEIYGFEDVPKQPVRPATPATLPWEDESVSGLTKWLQPASVASIATCNKLLTATFVNNIIGELPQPLQSVPELESMLSVPKAAADLCEFVKRAAKEAVLQKRSKCDCKIKVTLHDGTVLEDPKYHREGSYYEDANGVKYIDKVGLPTSVAEMSLCQCDHVDKQWKEYEARRAN
jgi:hypothetical protein